MTKLITLMMVCAFAVGCGGGKKNETTTTNKDTTTTTTDQTTDTTAKQGDATPCAQEIALQCPDGQIDGCLKTPAEGDTHKCVAK
jgi:hypothetical protein